MGRDTGQIYADWSNSQKVGHATSYTININRNMEENLQSEESLHIGNAQFEAQRLHQSEGVTSNVRSNQKPDLTMCKYCSKRDPYPMAPTPDEIERQMQDHNDFKLIPSDHTATHRCPKCGHLMYSYSGPIAVAGDYELKTTCVHCGYNINIPVCQPTFRH